LREFDSFITRKTRAFGYMPNIEIKIVYFFFHIQPDVFIALKYVPFIDRQFNTMNSGPQSLLMSII